MAKKATKQSVTGTTDLIPGLGRVQDSFAVNGEINMEDVLTVVVSEAEDHYTGEINKARAAIDQYKKEETAVAERLAAQRKVDADAVVAGLMVGLEDTVKIFKLKQGVGYQVVTNDKEQQRLQVSLSLRPADSSKWTGSMQQTTEVALSAEDKAIQKELDDLHEQISQAEADALLARKRLGNVPALTRRARAKVAKARLSGSQEGRDMLSALTQDLENEIRNLPVV